MAGMKANIQKKKWEHWVIRVAVTARPEAQETQRLVTCVNVMSNKVVQVLGLLSLLKCFLNDWGEKIKNKSHEMSFS